MSDLWQLIILGAVIVGMIIGALWITNRIDHKRWPAQKLHHPLDRHTKDWDRR